MAYNNLGNDGSLQQFSELWESSRYSQRMSADAERLRRQLPDLSLREMPNRSVKIDVDEDRGSIQVHQSAEPITEESSGPASGSIESRGEEEDKHLLPKLGTPSWLSNALMRQQAPESGAEGNEAVSGKWCSSCGAQCLCAGLETTSPSLANHPYTDWLSAVPIDASHAGDSGEENPGAQRANAAASSQYVDNVNEISDDSGGIEHQLVILGLQMESGPSNDTRTRSPSNSGPEGSHSGRGESQMTHADRLKNWQEARMKAKILSHPLFTQMLDAHVGCLRIATPVDQLSQIDEQLGRSQHVIDKYLVFAPEEGEDVEDKEELDEFMRNYTAVLMNMQEQLQHHVRVHATEAMLGCWELEQQLYALTGVSPGPGTGATMSDDEDEQAAESDSGGYDTGLDAQDSCGGFGPLVPTETERSLMERVRQELKLELNEQGYREKIVDVREEILRKRRAGKLPEGTTTVLKSWWNAHSKWPYPTEDEKERLILETGLELKQVNNWFINQRKRNWHTNPLSSSNELKSKRKG